MDTEEFGEMSKAKMVAMLEEYVQDSMPKIKEALIDRHDLYCGPKYGQPIHSCPDVTCRDAYAALGTFS